MYSSKINFIYPACAILYVIMTNAEQYSDVFTNINISPTSRAVALKAKGLLDLATGQVSDWESDNSHTSFRVSEQTSALQAFWDRVYDEDHELESDRLAITVMKHGLTVALEHRRRDIANQFPRETLFMSSTEGVKIFKSSYLLSAALHEPIDGQEAVEAFSHRFQTATAALGLHRRVVEMHAEYPRAEQFDTAV